MNIDVTHGGAMFGFQVLETKYAYVWFFFFQAEDGIRDYKVTVQTCALPICIVGNYVGLHPMTVIVSIFVWGLIIGGVLGPLLAVPLTATIKVLLGRYVWGRRLREEVDESIEQLPVIEESEAATQP